MMIVSFVISFIIACVISLVITPLVRKVSQLFNIADSATKTELIGGLAPIAAILFTSTCFYYEGYSIVNNQIIGIIVGLLIITLGGVIDDIIELSPFKKVIIQFISTMPAIYYGVNITLFVGDNYITKIITCLWIIGLMNSFNFLDNMDGLATGVGIICASILAMVGYKHGDIQIVYLSMITAGALSGFLFYNFKPAVIYLGDTGSLSIGYLLATFSVSANYLENAHLAHLPVLTPLLIFGLPLFDTCSVIVIRLYKKRPVWEADKNHFSHRLVKLGMTEKLAVTTNYLVTLAIGTQAWVLSEVRLVGASILLTHSIIIFIIIGILEYTASVPYTDL